MKTMLHYTTSGPSDGPVLLFLHGFMGSVEDWSPSLRRLEDRYRCVAIDLPGHGDSVRCEKSVYTMGGACAAICDVLDALAVRRCTPVGYSMGGRTALYFGLHYPERCRRLVLESASPGLATPQEQADRRGVDEARAVRLETEGVPAFLEDWYRQPLFSSLLRDADYLKQMLDRRRRNEAGELARSLRGMGTGQQPSLWERLSALRVSTLAIAGALDGKYVALARRMAVRSPRIRTVIVDDAGHVVHAERPTRFIDALTAFVPVPR